jgi:hypothetical protein
MDVREETGEMIKAVGRVYNDEEGSGGEHEGDDPCGITIRP